MKPITIEPNILYEDSLMIVIQKVSGMAVQSAGFGTIDLESSLKNYLAAKTPGKVPYVGIVQRLDQPVEGVLVFAKTASAAKELSRQMVSGEIGKTYLAVTAKEPPVKMGVLEDSLLKDGKKNLSKVVKEGSPGSKAARLSYEVLKEAEDSRVEGGKKYLIRVKLDTGRHHQIRVQLANAGMPLIGDRKYNPEEKSGYPLALCSCQLRLKHPVKKNEMRFEISPMGEAFRGLIGENQIEKD